MTCDLSIIIYAKKAPANLAIKTIDSPCVFLRRTPDLQALAVHEDRLEGQALIQHQQVGAPALGDDAGVQPDGLIHVS